jgi:ubiquitin-like modifier-activating enzyme ATG7
MMDPTRRIAEARDLNNNLMRWRVASGINLDVIKRSKVLVLGMGTLGCGVVRTLMVSSCFLGVNVVLGMGSRKVQNR